MGIILVPPICAQKFQWSARPNEDVTMPHGAPFDAGADFQAADAFERGRALRLRKPRRGAKVGF